MFGLGKKKKDDDVFGSSSDLGAPLGTDNSNPFGESSSDSFSNSSTPSTSSDSFGEGFNSNNGGNNSNSDISGNSSNMSNTGNFREGSSSRPEGIHDLHERGYSDGPSQVNEVSSDQFKSTDIALINSKLDLIKSELDALRQHILNIERNLDTNKKRPMW